jgi:hypothetical protein
MDPVKALLGNQLILMTSVLSVGIEKILALFLGYRIVKLGYDALVAGIQGKFDLGGKARGGFELRFVSASPGLLFVLLGTILIGWAIYVPKPVDLPDLKIPVPSNAPQPPPRPLAVPPTD